MNKPDKIREEMYDSIVAALDEVLCLVPEGRSKEGIVYEAPLDGSHLVVKVIKKKVSVTVEEMVPITSYQEKLDAYEAAKAETEGSPAEEMTEL